VSFVHWRGLGLGAVGHPSRCRHEWRLCNSGLNLLQLLSRRIRGTIEEGNAHTLELAMTNFWRLSELMEDILRYSPAENAPQQRSLTFRSRSTLRLQTFGTILRR
jgi:hypothetical protein